MVLQVPGSGQLAQDLHMRSHWMNVATKTAGILHLWISSLSLVFHISPKRINQRIIFLILIAIGNLIVHFLGRKLITGWTAQG